MRTTRFEAVSRDPRCDTRSADVPPSAARRYPLPPRSPEDSESVVPCALIEQFLAESRQHFGL